MCTIGEHKGARLALDIPVIAGRINIAIPILFIVFLGLGIFVSVWFHIGTAVFGYVTLLNVYYKYIQKKHAILRNYGLLGIARYFMESIGPELRQYLYANDYEEKPFNREERSEVYRKSKDVDSASSFGSQHNFSSSEIKIRHSMYPITAKELKPYSLTFGEERQISKTFTINKPFMVSAMSFGALGENAVRSLARGAKMAGIPINCGEGGYPKYHMAECDNVIFQMGTAKFGVRNDDATLNDEKLRKLASQKAIKMVEIKLSQGAKPGKGGLLPKEKITDEISELRHVPKGKDVISPPHHVECVDPSSTVKFIKRVQDISQLPVGIKLCLGSEKEFLELVQEMKRQSAFPDYIAVDGAEGGTGAAPKSFMDDLGLPLWPALRAVQKILVEEGVRSKLKLVASGKLINPGKQITALAIGADAIYTARGFMMAIGCIQALQCNKNTCPAGITTHDKKLQRGLDVEDKSQRVANYVKNLEKEFKEIMTATGSATIQELRQDKLYLPRLEQVVMMSRLEREQARVR